MLVSFLFYTSHRNDSQLSIDEILMLPELCWKHFFFKASERLKIIQVVSTIEFTKAQINMDKGMPFNLKNTEFQLLDCFRVSVKSQQIPLQILHSLLRDQTRAQPMVDLFHRAGSQPEAHPTDLELYLLPMFSSIHLFHLLAFIQTPTII